MLGLGLGLGVGTQVLVNNTGVYFEVQISKTRAQLAITNCLTANFVACLRPTRAADYLDARKRLVVVGLVAGFYRNVINPFNTSCELFQIGAVRRVQRRTGLTNHF